MVTMFPSNELSICRYLCLSIGFSFTVGGYFSLTLSEVVIDSIGVVSRLYIALEYT
jgi:hypothetical protein